MSHKRKDTFAKPKEWAKHLRPFGKRQQSKSERNAAKRIIRKDSNEQ